MKEIKVPLAHFIPMVCRHSYCIFISVNLLQGLNYSINMFGPGWWTSCHCPCLLLQQSALNPAGNKNFLYDKTKINKKEVGSAHISKMVCFDVKYRDWISSCSKFAFSLFQETICLVGPSEDFSNPLRSL